MVKAISTRKTVVVMALVTAAVALMAGVAIAVDSSSEQQDLAKTLAPKPTQTVAADERSAFSIATGQVGAKSKMASDPLMASHGVDPSAARSLETDLGSVTVIPGAESLCIFAADPRGSGDGGTCASYEDAKNGRLILTFTDEQGKGVSVFAVIADGIDSVTGVDRDGKTRSVSVKNNVAAFKSADPAAVEIGEIISKL